MDFPIFHMDIFNNRMLIGIIASLHVMINHAMAVGGIPIVVLLEYLAYKKGNENLDRLAFNIMKVFFIVTTSIGAMTGVGIWFSAGLINPASIGSLIRVFFNAWFVEWIVFVTEVCLIMFYFLTWQKWKENKKLQHIRVGLALAIASWITMVIIVAILSFMMDPGSWLGDQTFWSGFLNPIYLPQLAFRTPMAMVMAGTIAMFITLFATRKYKELRHQVMRICSIWTLLWLPVLLAGALWYARVVPVEMIPNLSVGAMSTAFQEWYERYQQILGWLIAGLAMVTAWGILHPKTAPRLFYILPIFFLCLSLGHFERVREFIRKPYTIADYLYANALRAKDYPLLQRDGLLKYMTYSPVREITPENELIAGKEVFMVACSRCHTVNGFASVKKLLIKMYNGEDPEAKWEFENVNTFLQTMHKGRPYMPPFPGNDEERAALANFLLYIQDNKIILPGAQTTGVSTPEEGDAQTAGR